MNGTTGFPGLFAMVDMPFAIATLLAAARVFGMLATFPLFTWLNINGLIRGAIALGIGMSVAEDQIAARALMDQRIWFVLVLLAKEVVIGALLGVLLGLPIWAAHVAGDVIDNLRGANASNIFDPVNAEEMTIGGQFNALVAMSCLVAIGGVALVFEITLLSFSVVPVESLGWPAQPFVMDHLRSFIGRVLAFGFLFAAPLVVFFLIAEIVLAFQSRLSRQFSLENVSAAAKSLAYVVILPLYGSFLYVYSETSFKQTFGELLRVFGAP